MCAATQVIATAEAELRGPQHACASSPEESFTVVCEPIPLDLPSCSPSTVQLTPHPASRRFLPPHKLHNGVPDSTPLQSF